jgi:hypothetical protein
MKSVRYNVCGYKLCPQEPSIAESISYTALVLKLPKIRATTMKVLHYQTA